ncbi:FHA domain-containing protein [Candidatus Poribacteria bacterium]|nr:FHA domain-containing protein [Candidatus Poribacteria bacterium]
MNGLNADRGGKNNMAQPQQEAVAKVCYKQQDKELIYKLTKSITLVGRDPTCDLQLLDDPFVSRHHAEIQVKPDGIYIVDLNSRNGVFIIAARWVTSEPDTPYFRIGKDLFKKLVKDTEKLETHDIILIGNTELRMEF